MNQSALQNNNNKTLQCDKHKERLTKDRENMRAKGQFHSFPIKSFFLTVDDEIQWLRPSNLTSTMAA